MTKTPLLLVPGLLCSPRLYGPQAAALRDIAEVVIPDWRKAPPSRAAHAQVGALMSSGILLCYVLFVGCLCTEWLLRRMWGLV